ncbi:hypothetical protein AALA99_07975 [Anaerotruncus colihominis]|uniref:hypothetical protein n=1 Tax=Anaerotruncus TaxID=244127 RepID=UPI00217387A7|nr:hypothetical protein [Anaerotruncus sp.]MCI8492260.1 hypothetical protein [Anaerotruncus sp.]
MKKGPRFFEKKLGKKLSSAAPQTVGQALRNQVLRRVDQKFSPAFPAFLKKGFGEKLSSAAPRTVGQVPVFLQAALRTVGRAPAFEISAYINDK